MFHAWSWKIMQLIIITNVDVWSHHDPGFQRSIMANVYV